jgi:Holliday junction resolvasome RuvABC ATP-dependent DNA helicase subunit
LRTLALKLGIDEISVEEDIERVLIKRWKIQKTTRGRILG